MGLLDGGMQGIFGAAFGAVYPSGYLLRTTLTDDGEGGYTTSHAVHAIKGQVDQASERMRRAEGYTDGDMRVIVLQSGVAVEPNTDDLAILGGKVWALSGIQADPAVTHWEMTGRLGVMPVPSMSFTSPTADNTPTILGTGLAGASIDLGYGASTVTGAATVAANGTWSATLPELADGTYAIRARQTLGGVTSAWASGGNLVVDTTAPAVPVITTASPFVTTDTTPSIAGTVAADAVAVTIYLDGEEAGSATLGSGTWAYTFDELDIATYSVTATATDALGNESAASAALSLTINAPLAISGTPGTDAVVGTAYSFEPVITGGVLPRTIELATGTLPAGLAFDTGTGAISGTPTEAGIFADIVIRVTDAEETVQELPAFTLSCLYDWMEGGEAWGAEFSAGQYWLADAGAELGDVLAAVRSTAATELDTAGTLRSFGVNIASVVPGRGVFSRGAYSTILGSGAYNLTGWSITNGVAQDAPVAANDEAGTAIKQAAVTSPGGSFLISRSIAVTSGKTYTFVFFHQMAVTNFVYIKLSGRYGTGTQDAFAWINGSTGVAGTQTRCSAVSSKLANGWIYTAVTVTAASTGTSSLEVGRSSLDGGFGVSSAGEIIRPWATNVLQDIGFRTPPILSGSTRSADALSVPDFAAVASGLTSGFEVRLVPNVDRLSATAPRVLAAFGADAANCCRVEIGTDNRVRAILRKAGADEVTLATADAFAAAPGEAEIVARFKPGDYALTVAGLTGDADADAETLPALTASRIGASLDGSGPLNGALALATLKSA